MKPKIQFYHLMRSMSMCFCSIWRILLHFIIIKKNKRPFFCLVQVGWLLYCLWFELKPTSLIDHHKNHTHSIYPFSVPICCFPCIYLSLMDLDTALYLQSPLSGGQYSSILVGRDDQQFFFANIFPMNWVLGFH